MKRALMLGLLTLIVGLLGTVPATANGSVGTPSVAPAGSQGSPATNQPQTTAGTGFTYQGSLNDGASPANGQYDFTFTLFDALAAGNQVGTIVPMLNHTVTNGLFTVTLDFGTTAFQGDARWLQIAVRPTGGGSYTTLAPRQALTATPYAMSLVPGAVINGATGAGGIAFNVNNSTGNSVAGFSGSATDSAVYGVNTNSASALGAGVKGVGNASPGVEGDSTSSYGGFFNGENGVKGQTSATDGSGVIGQADTGPNAAGVYGTSANGTGVYGTSANGTGVYGTSTNSGYGIYGTVSSASGFSMVGFSTGNNGTGIFGQALSGSGSTGLWGWGGGFGVSGNGNVGVYGGGATGVEGDGSGGDGVHGTSDTSSGVAGISVDGNGVYGTSTTGYAGWSDGGLRVTGGCTGCLGTFQIDDPLDPANKYLNQSGVASPDMLDILSDNVTTDANGNATVQLPPYFEALNTDFRYQLTVVGQFSQAIISSEVKNNTFTIKTDKPTVKVSWQVTGVRHDPYAAAHPIQPEQAKPANEQGTYLHPQELGQPASLGLDYGKNQTVPPPQHPQPPQLQQLPPSSR